jgi:hypothetical protein
MYFRDSICKAAVPPVTGEEQKANEQQRKVALEELEKLEQELGTGFIPDTLRDLLRKGKFPEPSAGAGQPQTAGTTHNGMHPKDEARRKAAQKGCVRHWAEARELEQA